MRLKKSGFFWTWVNGLGKTVTTLTAIRELKYNRFQVKKVLVIAPKKVAEGTWTKEKDKWDHTKILRVSPGFGKPDKTNPGIKHAGRYLYYQPGECMLAGGLLPEQLAV